MYQSPLLEQDYRRSVERLKVLFLKIQGPIAHNTWRINCFQNPHLAHLTPSAFHWREKKNSIFSFPSSDYYKTRHTLFCDKLWQTVTNILLGGNSRDWSHRKKPSKIISATYRRKYLWKKYFLCNKHSSLTSCPVATSIAVKTVPEALWRKKKTKTHYSQLSLCKTCTRTDKSQTQNCVSFQCCKSFIKKLLKISNIIEMPVSWGKLIRSTLVSETNCTEDAQTPTTCADPYDQKSWVAPSVEVTPFHLPPGEALPKT